MTAPGGDSGENPPGNADQPWADAGEPTPDQGGWASPSGPSSFEPYPPAPGYPPAGFPPPPQSPGAYPPPPAPGAFAPPGGYGPPPGYGPPTDYPGYGPPPGPPPGYPPAGYGTPPGYPPAGPGAPYPAYFNPGQAQKTNVLAISSLVVSLLGLLPSLVFWPLAVVAPVLGVIALSQIKRTGEAGYGMAVAGTAVGGTTVAMSFIIMLATVH